MGSAHPFLEPSGEFETRLHREFFKQNCANEFAFNTGIMMAAVWHVTGMVVVGVEGGNLVC